MITNSLWEPSVSTKVQHEARHTEAQKIASCQRATTQAYQVNAEAYNEHIGFFDFQRTFTTEPKFRIRRGHTITIRRCYEVAKHLWQCGIREKATREELENAVFYCAGGDHRTANRYIGRWLFTKPVMKEGVIVEPARKIKYIKGYLERIHFIAPLREHLFSLCFEILPFDVSKGEASGKSITNLCAHGLGLTNETSRANVTRQTTNKHNTHTNQLSESNLIDAILNAGPHNHKKGLTKTTGSHDPLTRMNDSLARLRKTGERLTK